MLHPKEVATLIVDSINAHGREAAGPILTANTVIYVGGGVAYASVLDTHGNEYELRIIAIGGTKT